MEDSICQPWVSSHQIFVEVAISNITKIQYFQPLETFRSDGKLNLDNTSFLILSFVILVILAKSFSLVSIFSYLADHKVL